MISEYARLKHADGYMKGRKHPGGGQGCLHVPLIKQSDLVDLRVNWTAKSSAAQQVISSLLDRAGFLAGQKSQRLGCSVPVDFASPNFANAVCVDAKMLNNFRVGFSLKRQDVRSNRFTGRKGTARYGDQVPFNTGNRVAVVRSAGPAAKCHGFDPFVALLTLGSFVGSPRVYVFRVPYGGAVSLARPVIGSSWSGATPNTFPKISPRLRIVDFPVFPKFFKQSDSAVPAGCPPHRGRAAVRSLCPPFLPVELGRAVHSARPFSLNSEVSA